MVTKKGWCHCPLKACNKGWQPHTLRMSLPVFAPDMSMRTVAG